MLEYLLKKFVDYKKTCPITDIEDKCVTFMRDSDYSKYLSGIDKDIWVIAPKIVGVYAGFSDNIKFCHVDNPDYVFTLYHNEVHENSPIPEPIIGKNCKIHPTVIMNVEGLKVANGIDGEKIQLRHIGGVIIEDSVEIGPYTVIHRGTFKSTIIKKGVKIGAKNNIAHNNVIGEDTVFAAGAVTNGSVMIGKNCWISSGVLIRNGISICDNVVIGLGAVVVKNIIKPGIYAGNPAKYIKPVKEGWNF